MCVFNCCLFMPSEKKNFPFTHCFVKADKVVMEMNNNLKKIALNDY